MKDYANDYCERCGNRWMHTGLARWHVCGPETQQQLIKPQPYRWATTPLGFISLVVMFYLLLWLATGQFERHVDCWSLEGSMGCAVVWEGLE